ncbi:MAG: glutathione S-transferase [Pseudomonadota bacterium]
MRPVLYSFRRCPYAIRARLALVVSQTQVELREVKLRDKPDAMLEASPKGTVPVLILPDGSVIDESLNVMHWALNQRDPEGWLREDEAEALIERNDGLFKYHLDRYKYPNRYDLPSGLHHRDEAAEILFGLDAMIRSNGSAIFGPAYTLADMATMPFVRQFAGVDRAWFDAQSWTGLSAWLEALTCSALFETAMVKRPAWAETGEAFAFP